MCKYLFKKFIKVFIINFNGMTKLEISLIIIIIISIFVLLLILYLNKKDKDYEKPIKLMNHW